MEKQSTVLVKEKEKEEKEKEKESKMTPGLLAWVGWKGDGGST